jgi:hypothetical protein
MRFARRRRWWAVAAVIAIVAVLVFAGYRSLDNPSWIYYYRVVDDLTVVAGTISGPGATVGVTNVTETPSTVTITVSTFLFELGPQAGVGYPYESVAKLQDPLEGRTVIDGSSGLPVQRATCPPPAYFAPVCP